MSATESQYQNSNAKERKPWQFQPGQSGNPAGRPKSQETMKEFARKWYSNLNEEEKIAYIKAVEEKRPGFAWTMAEGNPQEDKKVSISIPRPILGGATGAINQAVTDEILDSPSSDVALDAPQTETSDDKSE